MVVSLSAAAADGQRFHPFQPLRCCVFSAPGKHFLFQNQFPKAVGAQQKPISRLYFQIIQFHLNFFLRAQRPKQMVPPGVAPELRLRDLSGKNGQLGDTVVDGLKCDLPVPELVLRLDAI